MTDVMESNNVQIQLQQRVSKNWTTMRSVVNQPILITQAMEELKRRFPDQMVRAILDGQLIQIM